MIKLHMNNEQDIIAKYLCMHVQLLCIKYVWELASSSPRDGCSGGRGVEAPLANTHISKLCTRKMLDHTDLWHLWILNKSQ